MDHCWHAKISYGHAGAQCCHCGVRWWEDLEIPLRGHGRFAPKGQALPMPNKPCAPAEGFGKGGRSAVLEDVDFAITTTTKLPDHIAAELKRMR